jgi:excisionase family DNA binding protein
MFVGIKQVAKELGVSTSTLRRWESEGKICSIRTSGNHRRYNLEEISKIFKNGMSNNTEKENNILACCYARVSTYGQKSDLERQKQILQMFCSSKGYQFITIEDLGSGLNYSKKGLNELFNLIFNKKINKLVLTHKDRLIRFGSEIIFNLCKHNDIEVILINKDEEKIDDNKEFVNDVLEIITHFSAKLYGKRSHKNKKILSENKKLFIEDIK